MAHVKRIYATPYNLPLHSALKWGKGHQLDQLRHVLIFAELDDGAVGVAEATPRPSIYGETQASILAIVHEHLAPLVEGAPLATLTGIDALEHKTSIVKNNHTARGALNIALHVALARSQGRALGDLIGANREHTPLSYILGTGQHEKMLEEVAEVYAQGIRCLKVKVGKDLAREFALIEALRKHYGAGEHLALYADANQCLTLDNVHSVLKRLAEYDVKYCEEPLPVHWLQQRADLRRAQGLPIIGDDSCFTLADVERETAFKTVDIVNIKTARTGYSQSRWIAQHARATGASLMIGSQASSLLGCLHAIIFACQPCIAHETEGSFFLKVATPLTIHIHDGGVARNEAEAQLIALERQLIQNHDVG